MKIRIFFIALLSVGFVAAMWQHCSVRTLTTPQAYSLSSEEIASLKTQANGGNSEAALTLSLYFRFSVQDLNQEDFWLRQSAGMGNSTAKFNLAYNIIERGQKQKFEEAASLLSQLEITYGHEDNKDMLESIVYLREDMAKQK